MEKQKRTDGEIPRQQAVASAGTMSEAVSLKREAFIILTTPASGPSLHSKGMSAVLRVAVCTSTGAAVLPDVTHTGDLLLPGS